MKLAQLILFHLVECDAQDRRAPDYFERIHRRLELDLISCNLMTISPVDMPERNYHVVFYRVQAYVRAERNTKGMMARVEKQILTFIFNIALPNAN